MPTGDPATILAQIAECESGGDPTAVSPTGQYRGKYQFSQPTWEALGGTGKPDEAEETVQDELALALYNERGLAPWPSCGAKITATADSPAPRASAGRGRGSRPRPRSPAGPWSRPCWCR